MKLLDGGSKANWGEKLRFRTYWTLYFLIPIFIGLHIATGHPWKANLLIGVVAMVLVIVFRPRSE